MTRLWLLVAFLATTLCHFTTLAQKIPEDVTSQTTTPAPKKNATYWVTFSNKIRPGRRLELKVNILKGVDPVLITFTVLSSDKNKTFLEAPPTSVQPG
ncbi:unnamed protein product, partial [Lymnaea stagnalis]